MIVRRAGRVRPVHHLKPPAPPELADSLGGLRYFLKAGGVGEKTLRPTPSVVTLPDQTEM